MSNYNSNDALLEVFIFELSQLINQLEEQILTNEKMNYYSDSAVNEIFRIMHTLKGSSVMMGFENISSLAHSMEDLFYYIRRDGGQAIDFSELVDILLECVDFLKVEELKIREGYSLEGENSELLKKIKNLIPTINKEIKVKKIPCNNEILFSPISSQKDENNADHFYQAHIRFEDEISMENMRAYSIVHNLREVQNEIYYIPLDIIDNPDSAKIICKNGFYIFIRTGCCYETINNILRKALFINQLDLIEISDAKEFKQQVELFIQEDLMDEKIEIIDEQRDNVFEIRNEKSLSMQQNYVSAQESSVSMQHSFFGTQENSVSVQQNNISSQNNHFSTQQNHNSSQQSIISVNVTKLDKLMDLVGEMVIAKAMVIQNSDLAGLTLNNFNKSARQLNKITAEIQDMVMAIRMVPLSTTFHRMHRIIRDMNKKLGKETELIIIGENTEVDKNIIEHISDPLMHLIRNSVDHGIEMPEERILKGKSKSGNITIEAKNSGSDVHIQIKDDGKGLDRKKILQKAKENHMLTKTEEDISDSELFNMILSPGFSTKEIITEFSGRGVGMDVVSTNIELVGGSVSVESIPEQGTTITLKIPLTLAIIDGINIKVGSTFYTIPTTNIKEFFRPDITNIIRDPHGNNMIMVRGQCYLILKLADLFEVKGASSDFSNGIMIMMEENEKIICLFADELLGQQQVVVKTLPDYILRSKKIKGISGCTLLGNGGISLIIDVAALLRLDV